MRGRFATALVVVAAASFATPASAQAPGGVLIQFGDYAPGRLDVLPGETVTWSNVGGRTHTVTADDGSFASGELPDGAGFSHGFDAPGTTVYRCTLHPSMVGEVDVRPVILAALPPGPVPAGAPVTFSGRTAEAGRPVRVERAHGTGWTTVATATAAADGSWSARVKAQATGDYRAVGDQGASETRRLLVTERRVIVRATRRGVAVTTVPAAPNARVVLQQDLRDRFGWWPVRRARLDYVAQATFRVRRPARVRVVLVDRDGWTALATSRVVRLGHPRRVARPMHPAEMPHTEMPHAH